MLKWFRRRRVLIDRIKELEEKLDAVTIAACFIEDALCQKRVEDAKDQVWKIIDITSGKVNQFSLRAYCDGLKRRRADA